MVLSSHSSKLLSVGVLLAAYDYELEDRRPSVRVALALATGTPPPWCQSKMSISRLLRHPATPYREAIS